MIKLQNSIIALSLLLCACGNKADVEPEKLTQADVGLIDSIDDIAETFEPAIASEPPIITEKMVKPLIEEITLTFSRQDIGLGSLLKEYVSYPDILAMDKAINAVEKAGFKAGDSLVLKQQDDEIVGLTWYKDAKNFIVVSRDEVEGWIAKNAAPVPEEKIYIVDVDIQNNFYQALKNENMPEDVILEMARVLGFAIDFRSDIHTGNNFKGQISCQYYAPTLQYPEGAVDECQTVYARAEIGYGSVPSIEEIFRYESDGEAVFLDQDGKAAADFLLKVPINGARLSSNFNPNRRHPISGYVRAHKGTDFAAPTGTPIYAAGDGTIIRSSRYGGYGNYVRIKHSGDYETAYAHLSRYGKRSGRVRQGDVIGYVGSTGASTGPHLHYEVWLNGRAINSQTMKMPKVAQLEGDLLTAYKDVHVPTIRQEFKNVKAKQQWQVMERWARDLYANVLIADGSSVRQSQPVLVPN